MPSRKNTWDLIGMAYRKTGTLTKAANEAFTEMARSSLQTNPKALLLNLTLTLDFQTLWLFSRVSENPWLPSMPIPIPARDGPAPMDVDRAQNKHLPQVNCHLFWNLWNCGVLDVHKITSSQDHEWQRKWNSPSVCGSRMLRGSNIPERECTKEPRGSKWISPTS